MTQIMSLEALSNIQGARSSETIEKLFDTVRHAPAVQDDTDLIDFYAHTAVTVDDLRDDTVEESSPVERQIIMDNFPSQKNDYLVVPKVMEE